MIFEGGVFGGARVYGSEAERLFRLYESYGLEYVCVDVNRAGKLTAMIQMSGVSAYFNVVFGNAREAIRYARGVNRTPTSDGGDDE